MVKRISKKILATAFSFMCIANIALTAACNNPKTIVDYPEPSTEVIRSTDTGGEVNDIPEEEEIDEAFLPEPDSLREEGKFKYNPSSLNSTFKNQISNPKVIKAARKIMENVYNVEETFVLEDEYEITEAEFNIAYQLATQSSPMVDSVYITREDDTNYKVVYFPKVDFDERNQPIYGEGLTPEEAKAIFDEYETFVTDMINDNLTSENTDMERAEIIYKALIMNVDCTYSPTDTVEDSDDNVSEDSESPMLERVTKGELYIWELPYLYMYFLNQLHVDSMLVWCWGEYQPQNAELLDTEMGDEENCIWLIVTVDEKPYTCNIIFEKGVLDSQRLIVGDYDPDLQYFGMSDETRDKSMKVFYINPSGTINPVKEPKVPNCPEDYKKQ